LTEEGSMMHADTLRSQPSFAMKDGFTTLSGAFMSVKTILGNITGNNALLAKNAIANHLNKLEDQACSPIPTGPFIQKLNAQHGLVPNDQVEALASDVEKLRTQEVTQISRAANIGMRADLGLQQAKSTITNLVKEVTQLAAGQPVAANPSSK